jgi:putative hemolysin
MEFWILVLLILLSGFFAMSEMSIGASRPALLQQMAAEGNEGARIAAVGRIPKKAETFDWHGWRFEVVDMDKNRVDEVFARPIDANIPND